MSTRQVGGAVGLDEIPLRIDPVPGYLDEEISGLRKQVRRLRNVAQELDSEARFQNDMLNHLKIDWLDMLAVNDPNQSSFWGEEHARRLNKSIVQCGSSNVIHVVVFALLCFFIVYMLSKMSRS